MESKLTLLIILVAASLKLSSSFSAVNFLQASLVTIKVLVSINIEWVKDINNCFGGF